MDRQIKKLVNNIVLSNSPLTSMCTEVHMRSATVVVAVIVHPEVSHTTH